MPDWLDKEAATLIAAVLAALMSLAALVRQARAETRESHRLLIREDLKTLANLLWALLAQADVVSRRAPRPDEDLWSKRLTQTRQDLDEVSRTLRYPLWGLHEYVQQLTKVTLLAAHGEGQRDLFLPVLKAADELREALDLAIVASYRSGVPHCRVGWRSFALFWKSRSLEKLLGVWWERNNSDKARIETEIRAEDEETLKLEAERRRQRQRSLAPGDEAAETARLEDERNK
jgi:hypothetical protein